MHGAAEVEEPAPPSHAAAGLQGVFHQVAENDAQFPVGGLLRPGGDGQMDVRLHPPLPAQCGVVGDDGVDRLVFTVSLRYGGNGIQQAVQILPQRPVVRPGQALDGG